ncbi:MAG: hypothetical protein K2M97_00765, partial [Muribaculaceae bacterium]|nr:hypothetical protein [Muribaculaceae bacterium]
VEAVGGKELRISRTVSGDLSVGSKVTVTRTVEADRPMDYVVVNSPYAACMQPVDQLPRTLWGAYVEPVATATSFFLRRLPKGRTVLTEEFYITASGDFMFAPAQVQSQYAPEFTASSDGLGILVKKP